MCVIVSLVLSFKYISFLLLLSVCTQCTMYIHVWVIYIGYFAFYPWYYRFCVPCSLLRSPAFLIHFNQFASIANQILFDVILLFVSFFYFIKMNACFFSVFWIRWLPITTCSYQPISTYYRKWIWKKDFYRLTWVWESIHICITCMQTCMDVCDVRVHFHVKYLFCFLLDLRRWKERALSYSNRWRIGVGIKSKTSKPKFDRFCLRMRM